MSEQNTDYARKLVKVFGANQRDADCRDCGQPVSWYRTVTRQRWVLFDRAVRVGKERTDAAGQLFKYLDHKGIHWHHCTKPS